MALALAPRYQLIHGRNINTNTPSMKLIETDFVKKISRTSITRTVANKRKTEYRKISSKYDLEREKAIAMEEGADGLLFLKFLYEQQIRADDEFLDARGAQLDAENRAREEEREAEIAYESKRNARQIVSLQTRQARLNQHLVPRARLALHARDASPARAVPVPVREREPASSAMDVDVTNEAKEEVAPIASPVVSAPVVVVAPVPMVVEPAPVVVLPAPIVAPPTAPSVMETGTPPPSPTGEVTGMLNQFDLESKDTKENTEDDIEVHLDPDHLGCTLCPYKMDREGFTILVDCGHCFHFHCANKAFKADIKHRCPLCREVMKEPPITNKTAKEMLGPEQLDMIFGKVKPPPITIPKHLRA